MTTAPTNRTFEVPDTRRPGRVGRGPRPGLQQRIAAPRRPRGLFTDRPPLWQVFSSRPPIPLRRRWRGYDWGIGGRGEAESETG